MSTCATASRDHHEPLAGTAAAARTWLLVEQPGPWGGKALTESRLDPALGSALEAAAGAHGGRVALIRRPGRDTDRAGTGTGPDRHRVFLARTVPGDSWVRTALLPGDSLEALRELDFAALDAATGTEGAALGPGWLPYEGEPLAFVCTNGKRDRCCALLGRPLAGELAASGAGDIWEITHIGGHRFAPTLLVLPYGYAYGRLDATAAKAVLDAVRDKRVLTEGCRGRSAWGRPGQAADLAVRERTGESGADAVSVRHVSAEPGVPHWAVTVAHADGRHWRVRVVERTDGPPVPASCGGIPAGPARMEIAGIDEVARAGAA
ncbi:sucrase ferredoxin [Streptomyces iconiensis]|uniref:Sucrase ferredoxin n=1 Tax=Streptomyces iconiensis TaxID=1384038 RepID=A0ABT6ZP81_9ACTN|nr:sucrase ferredoxin [Streptomyces iconiensis]MDJ1130864.1 sucrase ferredoxin [Streptomyces iconiensis]